MVVAHFTKRFLPTLEDQGSNIITIFLLITFLVLKIEKKKKIKRSGMAHYKFDAI